MSNIDFEKKKIHDPIHKTIGLSELEIEIINTRAFQRLRNIKQLGLVNYVFPGADYTRFSHSIGVCHLTGQLYDAILKKKNIELDTEEKQKYRLAGLLHDIGHYPFSHTMEDALDLYYKDFEEKMTGLKKIKSTEPQTEQMDSKEYTPPQEYSDHETVGRNILIYDKEIQEIFQRNDYEDKEIKEIYDLFSRGFESPTPDANMISSDLDADRLDYLLRTSHHVGLPYGSTDIEYIISQLEIDNKDRICLNPKAIRTVDHFLLCRYFDYSQVVHHKTVAGLEEILKKIIIFFIEENKITCSTEDIIEKIKNDDWCYFDDNYILNLIKEYYNKKETPTQMKLMMKSILLRKPPKEIVKLEYIKEYDENKKFQEKIKNMKAVKDDIITLFGINNSNIFLWNNILEITKARKTLYYAEVKAWKQDKLDQAVRIYEGTGKESTPIIEREDSLMNILSNKLLYSARLFILFESDSEKKDKSEKIKDFVVKNIRDSDWK